ncbi:MAG: hypothetical protein R2731_13420 [Nocardioides sp.]
MEPPRHDPAAPDWADRDRFVLSAGHGSALLYGLLHVFGYDSADGRAAPLPAARVADPGPPRGSATPRRRDHDRATRAGPGDGGGLALAERMAAARYPRSPTTTPTPLSATAA